MVWCVQDQPHRRCCTATVVHKLSEASGYCQQNGSPEAPASGTPTGCVWFRDSRVRVAPDSTVFGRSSTHATQKKRTNQALFISRAARETGRGRVEKERSRGGP